tara:strand:- start:2860 stop:3297 length:438 start_codon:yes stop_codon:yes gene_type:complete
MVNTKDYSETRKQLKELIDKWGKSNVIKGLHTNHKQVQSILDNKKQFLTKKIIDRINNFYLETFGDRAKTIYVGDYPLSPLDTSEEVFKKYLNQAENKITNAYADKEYNKKVMKLYKKIDRLWSVIFLLCLLLIVCSGLIIHLAR